MEEYEPDIVGLAETRHVQQPKDIPGYTFIGKYAKSTSQSGTGIYIKNFKGYYE